MLTKTVAVLALAASCVAISISPSLAGSKARPVGSSENSPWYDTGSNAAYSSANLKETVLNPSTVPKIKYLRSITAPPPNPSCPLHVTAPVLVGGDLYVATGNTISKYNAATGALLWRVNPDPSFDSIYESLSISGNLVIVGSYLCNDPPLAGEIFAFNNSTGAPVWNTGFNSAAGIAVVAQSYVVSFNGNGDGALTEVLDIKTGGVLWSDDSPPCAGPLPLVVAALVMTYGCDSQGNPELEAKTLANGTIVWSVPGNWRLQRGDISGTPGKHLFATNPSGTVVDLNPLTGRTVYSLSGAIGVLAVDSSRVYANCSGDNNSDLCAYNINTGAMEWDAKFLASRIAAEAGGVLYINSNSSNAPGSALNAATGAVIQSNYDQGSATSLAVGDGRIAVVNDPRVLDLYGLKGY